MPHQAAGQDVSEQHQLPPTENLDTQEKELNKMLKEKDRVIQELVEKMKKIECNNINVQLDGCNDESVSDVTDSFVEYSETEEIKGLMKILMIMERILV